MVRQLALAALVVGTLDIGEVILFFWFRGVGPMRVVQGVASGLLGKSTFDGGIRTALLGLAVHFFIATMVVSVYYFASRRIAVLRRSPVLMGIFYGLLVYAFMYGVVLPLSAAGPPKFTWPFWLNGPFAHVFCVGIPTGLLARAKEEPMFQPA
jgi:hypothetical protein